VVEAEIAGDLAQVLALAIPLADRLVAFLPLGLGASPLPFLMFVPVICAAFRSQDGGSGFTRGIQARKDNPPDRAAVALEDALDDLLPVGDEMPAVGHLHRLWSALPGACGILLTAVTRDDLGAGIRF
jgi:hypothetical protein